MESDVAGIISATSNMKTVRDSNTVIPGERETETETEERHIEMLLSPFPARQFYHSSSL